MKTTNRLGLPSQFMVAARRDSHPLEPRRYYATELLKPTRAILIRREHDDELEEDVSDMIPAMFGSAFHRFMEENTETGEAEFKVEAEFGEDTVSGTIDLWDRENGEIWDYKTCSVSKVMKADFEDWRLQGLTYASLIWKTQSKVVKKLKFFAIMKDWSKVKAAAGGNYPQSAVYVWEYEISESDYDFVDGWIRSRLWAINEHIGSGTYPACSMEDSWYTGDKYAVYRKVTDKRAMAVCDSMDEAEAVNAEKCGGEGHIEIRFGEKLRCKHYCDCRKWCAERR